MSVIYFCKTDTPSCRGAGWGETLLQVPWKTAESMKGMSFLFPNVQNERLVQMLPLHR